MDYWANQPSVLTFGTKDQAQIIRCQAHYAKTQLSGKVSCIGKGGSKEEEENEQQGEWIQFIVVMDALLEDLKDWVRDRAEKSIYVVTKCQQ